MQDVRDFSLRITVMPPEPAVDERATTTPFVRPALPGVTMRPAPRAQPPQPPPRPMAPPPRLIRAQPLVDEARPPAPRAHASPLSRDDEARARRRARALRKIAWARNMLQRFHFGDGA